MAMHTQSRFAAWADPLYVFPMPDETPFGLDRSLVGRPVIDYTGHSSMNDNLRLQRLILQLSEHVSNAVRTHESSEPDSASAASSAAESAAGEVHESIMGTAEAVFREMSHQSYRADRALAVDQLWGCLSTYLDHCATLAQVQTNPAQQSEAEEEAQTAEEEAQAAEEGLQAAEEAKVASADNASRDLAADAAEKENAAVAAEDDEEEESAEASDTAEEEEDDAAETSTAEAEAGSVISEAAAEEEERGDENEEAEEADAAAAAEADAAAGGEGAGSADEQEADERHFERIVMLAMLQGSADLLQENQRLKAQIQSLTARLSQHAQHAQQLLAGTEPFFGAQAGRLIGQPLEEDEENGSNADSDSDESFASARERALSRPLSASSSFRSADSSGFSSAQSRNLSVSPDKGPRGFSKGLQGGESGAAVSSFETAREEALSSIETHAAEAQATSEESEPEQATGQRKGRGRRKALRAFLHKLRPSLQTCRAVPQAPEALTADSPTSPSKPSLGSAADRAAAQQFAQGLSHTSSIPRSPAQQLPGVAVVSPFAADPAGPTPETPKQEVPPSMRVRTLSRQFSQQEQPAPQARVMARSLTSTPTTGRGHAMSSIWEQSFTSDNSATASVTAQPASVKAASVTGSTAAGAAGSRAASSEASQLGLHSTAAQAFSNAASLPLGRSETADRAQRKTASAAKPSFAFGGRSSSTAAEPSLSRSATSRALGRQAASPAAAGTTAGAVFAFGSAAVPTQGSSKAQVPFAAGTAPAATAATAFGQLVGFGAGSPAESGVQLPAQMGGFMGSAFHFAAGNNSAAAAPQLTVARQASPNQDASGEALPEAEDGTDADEDAADAEDGFALPADLLEDEPDAALKPRTVTRDAGADDEDQSDSDAATEAADTGGSQSQTGSVTAADQPADETPADNTHDGAASDSQAADPEETSTGAAQSEAGSEEEEQIDDSAAGEDEEGSASDDVSDENSSEQGASNEEEGNSADGTSDMVSVADEEGSEAQSAQEDGESSTGDDVESVS